MVAQYLQTQKMESVGRLTVAHDFNNILSVIIGYADMAMRKVDPGGDLHEYLDKILDAAERSAGFVKQLLAFSRNQAITSKALDLNEVVTGTLSMLHRLIGEEIDLNWNPGAGLPPVLMDPTQVSQILVKLSVNARDAIDGAGTITIETRLASFDEVSADEAAAAPGLYVVLEVSDTGCGVPPNILEHIFEPFLPPRDPRAPVSAWPPCTASSSRTTASSAQPANRNGAASFASPSQHTTFPWRSRSRNPRGKCNNTAPARPSLWSIMTPKFSN